MTKKKVEIKPVNESTRYESLMGVKETATGSLDLTEMMDLTEEDKKLLEVEEEAEWKKLWQGMPEYKQEDNPTYKTIYVHFRNKEDYEEFAKLIDQNLSDKTKSIWHPKLDRTENALLRWIVE